MADKEITNDEEKENKDTLCNKENLNVLVATLFWCPQWWSKHSWKVS